MSNQSKEYFLIEDEEPLEQSFTGFGRIPSRLSQKFRSHLILFTFFISLASNLGLAVNNYGLRAALKVEGLSKYARLGFTEQIPYRASTAYSDENETYVESLWDSLDTDPGGISLSYEWAEANDLPRGNPFPWHDGRGLFYIKGFHDLHCLKLIKKSLNEYRREVPQTVAGHHVSHCVDALKQSVMCAADDTPLPTQHGAPTGEGQMVQCRDWNKLLRWAQDPEKESCYKIVDEYREPKHNLERFQFCSKEGLYYENMISYFQKWGHQDMWP